MTINKAERLNACVRRAGGQVLTRAGGKQPVSMATSPAFHSAAAGCETEERGGRRALCVCLLGFGWKDLKRSLLRGAGIRQKAEKFFNAGFERREGDYNLKLSAAMDERRNSEVSGRFADKHDCQQEFEGCASCRRG